MYLAEGKKGYNVMLIIQQYAVEHKEQNLLNKLSFWNARNIQLRTAHQMRSDILT